MIIHIIDLSKNQDSYPRFKRDFGPENKTVYYNGFTGAFPPARGKGLLVLTGSEYSITKDFPWFDPLMDYVRDACERGRPLLGVCYGHQLIARALAGRKAVGRAAVPEVTFTLITITTPHPIFKGLPSPFKVMSSHYDEVTMLPPGFKAIARSANCRIQAMAHGEKPVAGIQFHPEIEVEKARSCIREERRKLLRRGLDPDALLAQIPQERLGAQVILTNFARYAGRKT